MAKRRLKPRARGGGRWEALEKWAVQGRDSNGYGKSVCPEFRREASEP